MKKQLNPNRLRAKNNVLSTCLLPKSPGIFRGIFFLVLGMAAFFASNAQVYSTVLSGAAEAPPNASPGTGTVVVTINVPMATMRVQANFTGLTGTTTAAHIHGPTAVAGTSTAGVATSTPNFTGFPLGVTSGSYDNTFDMALASSYNPAFVTANGGNTASAFIALKAAIDAGKAYFNVHSTTFGGGEIRGFLACTPLMYAYNASNKHLVSFLASSPGTLLTDVALNGLAPDEVLKGFDYRPADGQFYGITSRQSTNMGRVVSINRTTGSVVSTGSGLVAVPFDSLYAVDFNPVPDRIRLISSSGRSRRYNPNDGTLAATDVPLAFVAGDPNQGDAVVVSQCAYTKSIAGTPNTTLFAIDFSQNLLVRVGSINGAPVSPNAGAVTTIGSLGVATSSGTGGFDIDPSGMAYAIMNVGGVSGLYTIDTLTGASTLVGAVPGVIDGLTIIPCSPPPPSCTSVMYAYNAANKNLVSFRASAPGTLLSNIPLSGLEADEVLKGFDYRPADGQFYGITSRQSTNMGRVVSINRITGAVASTGPGLVSVPFDSLYAVDFNPVPDRIRLISSSGRSRRYNPNDGTLAATDVPLAFVAGDPNAGSPVVAPQCAYTKSIAGTPNTTLFAIDNSLNILIRVGSNNGAPVSPNAGACTTIGSLGVSTSGTGGFDIDPSGMAYAILNVGGVSGFYTIDTLTGAATLLGTVPGTIDGLTIVPCAPPVCVTPAARIYVDASVAVSGSGSSWSCAMKELSAAITMANATPAIKSIWVADGTYKPTTGTSRTAVMAITRADLRILGGFAGGEANASDANPSVYPAIISGDIGVAGDASDNSYRLMNIGGSPVSASALVIDGFTFRDGNANGSGDNSVGAALLSNAIPAATPVLINRCIFRNNSASASGGAVYLTSSGPSFEACRFASNAAGSAGGAVYSFQASPVFSNTVFVANTAANGGGYYGNYGTPSFTKTVFTGNGATYGGGVYQNNQVAGYGNCVFNANTSYQGGAIYEQNGSVSNIKNSTFFKNSGVSYGGAIVLTGSNSRTTTENSVFWKNTHDGSATSPWADFVNYTGGANVYANNILQLNTAVPADNGTTIRNNTRGTDPLFVNEASVLGADGVWGTTDDGLELTNGSPAKNTGDNALAPAGTDITNSPRIVCAIVDKGAYENQGACGPIADEVVEFTKAVKTENADGTGAVVNPFRNDLQIRYMGAEKAGINVSSASGKMMSIIGSIKQGITRIDASTWSSGLYEVVITTASGKRTNFKVVKM
ncbi:MAG: DUF4394 domain-containing protein [Bacteroidota bacterium]